MAKRRRRLGALVPEFVTSALTIGMNRKTLGYQLKTTACLSCTPSVEDGHDDGVIPIGAAGKF